MTLRTWILLAVGALGLLALPILAQPACPGWTYGAQPGTGQPLSMAQAETIARQAAAQWGTSGLVPMHIMEFSNNFYVAVKEKATGQGAFELLIARYTGFVHPEPQSMMWNTKYGHMPPWGGPGSGMMGPGYGMMGPGYRYGGGGAEQPGAMPLTRAQAKAQAQQFLDARTPGASTDEAIAFPGYYTIDVARSGHPIGMLSVNAYTGQVWYHVWHGAFVQERDLD